MVPDWQFEVAPNFPEVDIEDLRQYEAGTFDVVVLDQVLEHVADDERAVAEVHRILRPGGMLIATTPFLIQVHGYPHDYRRYTAEGLRRLFRAFSPIELQTWGNRFSVQVIAKFGWLTSRNAKRLFVVAPWNEPDWPIDCAVICWK